MTSIPKSQSQQNIALAVLREKLTRSQKKIQEKLFSPGRQSGYACVRSMATLVDSAIKDLYQQARKQHPHAPQDLLLAVIAVGGYGRREMAPFSDVDLLFLTPSQPSCLEQEITNFLLYGLWDLGFTVGHALRPLKDCLYRGEKDHEIGTSLQESRFLLGNAKLFSELQLQFSSLTQKRSPRAFIRAKLSEREKRRSGESSFVLEPNLKNGRGALRDLQMLLWIGHRAFKAQTPEALLAKGIFTQAEATMFVQARDFLWRLRCHLHLLCETAQERLAFSYQEELSQHMSFRATAGLSGEEKMMRQYFRTTQRVGHLSRVFLAALEEQKPPRFGFTRNLEGFPLRHRRLNIENVEILQENPSEILRFFHIAQKHGVKTHPNAWRVIARALPKIGRRLSKDPKAHQYFLQILSHRKDAGITMRRLAQSGALSVFLPEFAPIFGQMQFHSYHHYTVDEHTFRALEVLQDMETGKLGRKSDKHKAEMSSRVIRLISSHRALFLGMFFHDLGKGRKTDHSIEGGKIARRFGRRIGMEEGERETVVWLVENHLLMTSTAFHRDLDDPQTVEDFAQKVGSPERLRLLFLLTIADVCAVGPNVWNRWKGILLGDLFLSTERFLTGAQPSAEEEVETAQVHLRKALQQKGWKEGKIAPVLKAFPKSYWSKTDLPTWILQAELIGNAQEKKPSFATWVDTKREVVSLSVCAEKRLFLFSDLAGAVASAGGNIISGEATSLSRRGASKSVLYTFYLRYPHQDSTTLTFDRKTRLGKAVQAALSGKGKKPKIVARKKPPPFHLAPWIVVSNRLSRAYTVIEVSGPDQTALLYRLTCVLAQQSLHIRSAKIATCGDRVTDVFYVRTEEGKKFSQETGVLTKSLLGAFGKTPLPLDVRVPVGRGLH